VKVQIDDVEKVYRTTQGADVVALERLSLSIEASQFVSLVGPSGCGKSTLLHTLAGLIAPTSGRVSLGEEGSVPGTPGARPGIVFQKPQLLAWRGALQNVMLPAELGRRRERRLRRSEQKGAVDRDRALELLELVGLSDFPDSLPHELSGGMQQRVALARALLLNADVVLMDEPFGALDEFTREQLNEELLRIWENRRFTCLFVTHNVYEAVFLSDRILVMSARPGRLVADITCGLPRPRSQEIAETDSFHRTVAEVRRALRLSRGAGEPVQNGEREAV